MSRWLICSLLLVLTACAAGALADDQDQMFIGLQNHWQLEFIRGDPVSDADALRAQPEHFHTDHVHHDVHESSAKAWRRCEIVGSAIAGYYRGVEISGGKPVLETRPLMRDADHTTELLHTEQASDQFVVCRARREVDCLRVVHEQCVGTVTDSHATAQEIAEQTADDEVFEFRINGPAKNRISLVFMGDGYTAAQRQDYIDDMERLISDMFNGVTFASYLPTMNIYGVFRPSRETGIGTGGRPKDTSFGLYRDGTELRGVYCSKPQDARNAAKKIPASAFVFPTLIGLSPFYGGLGGEFAISTSSVTSGTVVYRHELGHNLVAVGEEYDGGSVYSGPNWSRTVEGLGWKHWLTEPTNLREERADILVQDYAWYDLARGAYRIRFTSSGTLARWYLVFTVSGADLPNSIAVYMDGKRLDWKSEGNLDRTFYRFYGQQGFSAGQHELAFEQLIPPAAGGPIRQLCSVTMHEYAAEPDYHWDNDRFIGAYRTYRQGKVLAGYRPNNEFCLMRNMTSPHLCPVCQEGLWMQFLAKVSLVDGVEINFPKDEVKVQLQLVPLGQLRPPAERISGERYEIVWTRNGERWMQLDDKLEWTSARADAAGKWQVIVKFHSPEIRSDPRRLTEFKRDFVLTA